MMISTPAFSRCFLVTGVLIVTLGLAPTVAAPVVSKPDVSAPVTVVDNGTTWTLDNGIVKATINKRSGNMASLIYPRHRDHECRRSLGGNASVGAST